MSRTLKLLFLVLFFAVGLFAAEAKLVSVKTSDTSVVLEFSSPVSSDDIKQNKLDNPQNKSTYRSFFDIRAVSMIKPQSFTKTKLFDALKVSQFDKEHIRVVAVLDTHDKLVYRIDGKSVIVENEQKQSKEKQDTTKSQDNSTKSENTKNEAAKDVLSNLNLESDKKQESTIEPSLVNNSQPQVPDKRKIIVIDPGHGGKDSGAIGINSKKEKNIVFAVAVLTKELLEKRGYKVLLTRDGDYFVELQDRTRFADSKGADLFLSIHANAVDLRHSDPGKAKGVETFFLSPARSERAKRAAEKENGPSMDVMDSITKGAFLNVLNREKIVASNKFAIDIHRAVLANLRAKFKDTVDGGVREAPFWVLVGAQMPAVLVEIGYITNPDEAERFDNPIFRNLLARGLADAVDSYFENN